MIKSAGKLFYRLNGFYPVTIQKQRFRCDPHHIGFWRLVNKGKFEPYYYQILDKFKPEKIDSINNLTNTSRLCVFA